MRVEEKIQEQKNALAVVVIVQEKSKPYTKSDRTVSGKGSGSELVMKHLETE